MRYEGNVLTKEVGVVFLCLLSVFYCMKACLYIKAAMSMILFHSLFHASQHILLSPPILSPLSSFLSSDES